MQQGEVQPVNPEPTQPMAAPPQGGSGWVAWVVGILLVIIVGGGLFYYYQYMKIPDLENEKNSLQNQVNDLQQQLDSDESQGDVEVPEGNTGDASGPIASMLAYAGLGFHFASISRGVIDSRDILYYASFIGFFMYLNLKVLKARR